MHDTSCDVYVLTLARRERLQQEAANERLARALQRERKATTMTTPDRNETDALRAWIREQIESGRRLRLRAAAFALGMLVLTPVWAVSEYLGSRGWPQRLSANGNSGDWSPWIIWVALAWGFYVALTAVVIHLRRPPVDDREIDRELARLTGRGRRLDARSSR